jgi:hypothetical protein
MIDQPIDESESSSPRPAPRRAPGLLGRFFGLPQPQPRPQPPRDPSQTTSRDASRGDAVSKPDSADLAAKRRIERQIRETLGDRVNYVEVRITGRNAVVVAQPSRFWFRRSVRRALETLPALEGYRARIELRE